MTIKTKLLSLTAAVLFVGAVIILVNVVSHKLKTDPKKAMLGHGKMPVKLTRAKSKQIYYVIGASGQLQESERVTLTARIEQPVISVNVKIGDKVQKGQVILEFEQRLIKAAAEEAKENLNNIEIKLQYSKLKYQRLSDLDYRKFIPEIELWEAHEKIKELQWKYSDAVLKLKKALQDMDNTIIRAPFKGIVLEKPINQGEFPKLNANLITIGFIDKIHMMAKVTEDRFSYVHLGQETEIHFDSFKNELFKGKVIKIDPNVDSNTRTFIAYIEIPNNDHKLVPGLTGFARMKIYKMAITVPSISVVNPVRENTTVFVVTSDSIAHIRSVKTGISTDGLTEIIEGLKEGDKVITAGIQFLKDGDKVNIMGEE